jgi:tRNA nucleotidyltransferase (CCA-adding enzyme)
MRPASAPPSVPETRRSAAEREIVRSFDQLPDERRVLLRRAAQAATATGCDLYWVGGGVRDLWLGTFERDVDLVVDGDLPAFTASLAQRLQAGVRSHPQFMTAELDLPDGVRVDLARARTESYREPAALPVVEPAAIDRDLGRRDFTINCLAIPLAPVFGERLIDPCRGLADLLQKRIRTLHRDSFRDDPTRLLRAAEFEVRFEFEMDPDTLADAEAAIAGGAMARLSSSRLRGALKRALGRATTAGRVLRRLDDLRILQAIDPALDGSAGVQARFETGWRELPPPGPGRETRPQAVFRLALLSLVFDLGPADRERLARRLDLAAPEAALVELGPERVRKAVAGLGPATAPSAVHQLLAPLEEEELALVAATGEAPRGWVSRELREMRPFRLAIGGAELLAAGVAAGPLLGRALDLTLRARLDGKVGQDQELGYALRIAEQDASRGVR